MKSSMISEPLVCWFFVAVYWFVFPNADLEFSAPFAGEEKWYQKEGMQLTTALQPSHRERGRKEMQIVLQDPHSNASWNSSKNVGPFKQVLKESKFIALLSIFFLHLFSSTLKVGAWGCYTSFKASLIFTSLFVLFVLKAVPGFLR